MDFAKEFLRMTAELKANHPAELFQDKQVYGDWLAQTYYFVCHSVPLLGYALSHIKDPQLRRRFEKHIGEEEQHELLLKKDLERLGFGLEDFPEHPETQAFYQGQYYRVHFEGGVSLLGYILFLEGMAVHWGKGLHEALKAYHPQSLVFLHVHVSEDPEHLESALSSISKLSSEEQKSVINNFYYSHTIYKQILLRTQERKKGSMAA